MEYWSKDGNEQEMTFYRRFASLLDVLFGSSEIKMAEYVQEYNEMKKKKKTLTRHTLLFFY
jgi:hypothetical protein